MNFLAHIYLSYNDEQLAIGNFIADSVRGSDYSYFPKRIEQGIWLHRQIDTYTDSHEIVRRSKDLIRQDYGHYSGVIVDLYYDHLLASNWNSFHHQPLEKFTQKFYRLLNQNTEVLPKRVQNFLPFMIAQDWLTNYQSVEGISVIFSQMNRRTSGKGKLNFAPRDLVKYYPELKEHFFEFMIELEQYVKNIYPEK